MNTNQAMYKSAVASINKQEEYPSIIGEIGIEYARRLFKLRRYEHHVSIAGHIHFTDQFRRPIKVSSGRAYIMSFDVYKDTRQIVIMENCHLG